MPSFRWVYLRRYLRTSQATPIATTNHGKSVGSFGGTSGAAGQSPGLSLAIAKPETIKKTNADKDFIPFQLLKPTNGGNVRKNCTL
jgi:hypothetical protein